MTTWRARLAAIRAGQAAAGPADSSTAGAIGTTGTNDIGVETANGGAVAARLAFYVRFQAEAAAALAGRDRDPVEDAERAAVFGGDRCRP